MGFIIVANAALSAWLEGRGFGPGPALRQFVVTGLLNAAMLFLVTLLVTLYDRYRREYVARFSAADA